MSAQDVVAARTTGGLPRKRIRWGEVFVQGLLFLAAAISVLTTLGIVASLLQPAFDFFT
jgi:phosphate transport system permease protein